MRPKLIAGVLVGGIVVLGGGSAVAASLPSWTTRPAHVVAAAPTAAQAASASPARSPSASIPARSSTAPSDVQAAMPDNSASPRAAESHDAASITYTVKRGDTLSAIAEWFMLHGYGALYEANKSVIGANPNLIFAGERITIAHGVMKVSKRP
jgi:nucleoid-associated protein YgaU